MDNAVQRATWGPILQHRGAPASKGCHIHRCDDPEWANNEERLPEHGSSADRPMPARAAVQLPIKHVGPLKVKLGHLHVQHWRLVTRASCPWILHCIKRARGVDQPHMVLPLEPKKNSAS